MQSETIKELAKALAIAQGKITGAKKQSVNPHLAKQREGGGKYADLASVWDSIREPFSENGLSVVQGTEQDQNGGMVVVSTLMHSSGEWVRSELPVKNSGNMQLLGAEISYARRYLLSAQAGVYQVDLEGLEESGDNGEKKTGTATKTPPKDQGSNGNSSVRFATPQEQTAFKKECFRLKIPTSVSNSMLNEQGIPSIDKIPADRFNEMFKALEFMANEIAGTK